VTSETFDPFAGGVLVEGMHDTLVANLSNFAATAGIHVSRICTPLAGHCSEVESEYICHFNKYRVAGVLSGLCYTGKSVVDAEDHMASLAGALVRNFVGAKVATVGKVLDLLATGGDLSIACLLIPNFFVSKANGGGVSPWQIPLLLDMLMDRRQRQLQTVIYASSFEMLDKEYGLAFGHVIQTNFRHVKI
jgi:hypothetical protein